MTDFRNFGIIIVSYKTLIIAGVTAGMEVFMTRQLHIITVFYRMGGLA